MSSISEAVESAAEKIERFLSSFSSKNVALFYDDDPDGICSGVILEKLLERKGFSVKLRLYRNKEAPPYSEKFIENIKKNNIDLLVSTDFCIAGFGFHEAYKKFITEENIKVLNIDHHQDDAIYSFDENKVLYINSNNTQKEISGSQYCCSKFTYDIAVKLEPGLVILDWVASIGIIGDSNYYTWGNFIKEVITKQNKQEEKEIPLPEEPDDYYLIPHGKAANYMFFGIGKERNEIQKIYEATYSARDVKELLNFLKQYDVIKREAYDYIENYEYLVKNNPPTKGELNVAEIEILGDHLIGNIVANLISARYPETIFFVYHKQSDGYTHISSRLQTGKINLGKIFEKCGKNLENTNAGGHINAAGCRVPDNLFKSFRNSFYGELEHA